AQEETARTRGLFHSIIENLPTGVFVKEAERLSFKIWNKSCEELYGFTADKMLGKTARDIFSADEAASFEAQDRYVLNTGRRIEIREQQVTTPEKGVRILRSKKVPIMDQDGKPTHVVGISEDITELKNAENGLVSALEAAEQASRAKSSFLANMSHEIRTPMNGIIGMTELTLNTDLTSEQREYLEAVKISGESLLRLINDILDFSKIEAGKFELVNIEFSLRDSIAQAMTAVSLAAHSKDLELVYHIPPQIPDILVGDPGRLNQVLINLLGNGIKFTHTGEIALDVQSESETEDRVSLHFVVRDTGIGVPPEKRDKIFNAFEQADGSTTRKYGGTGLGLAISAQLVQMMNGRIWLESELGRGSTFHFTARFGLSSGPLRRDNPMDLSEFKGLRVLIVDDNAMNRFVLKEILTYWGMAPVTVESASEALETMQDSLRVGKPFSLVILDYLMPDVDGFELAERINEDPNLSGVTMIMLTSAGQRGDASRCLKLGIKGYCLKPVKQSDLFEIISSSLNKSPVDQIRPTLVTRHSLREGKRRLRVLLAEDNAINQTLATRILEKMGHAVTVAKNGIEVLDACERDRFDVILMDVQMPEMDGFEATRLIRQKERGTATHIPIIAMTAHAMAGDRERCLAEGMDGYVSKPINAEELVGNLEKLTDKRQNFFDTKEMASESSQVVDRTKLFSRVGHDVELLKELVDLFLDTGGSLLSHVERSVNQLNAEAIERSAHAIKGALGNFAADRAFEAALRLETMAREGSLKHAASAYKDLEREINLFTDFLVTLRKNNFQDIRSYSG
ncbi:MAG: response regulator, partial [Desulfomonilaceae bacterium]